MHANTTELVDNRTIFMQNTKEDGPNIESPQIWYQEYPENQRRAYHLIYNAGCFADSSYRTELITCWIDETVKSFVDCPWQDLKKSSHVTLLQTKRYPQPEGRPEAVLMAPGGPGVSQDGKYMACELFSLSIHLSVTLILV